MPCFLIFDFFFYFYFLWCDEVERKNGCCVEGTQLKEDGEILIPKLNRGSFSAILKSCDKLDGEMIAIPSSR